MDNETEVVILSAGMASRLRPLTLFKPKPLLQIGDHLTILESQLNAIEKVGIKRVHVIIGYLASMIEEMVSDIQKKYSLEITTIYNPFFDISNNMFSLWMAFPRLSDDFIVTNGDNLFRSKILKQILEKKDNNITVTVSRKDQYSSEDMKVITDSDRILRISKQIPIEEANGESIGIVRFKGMGSSWIKNEINMMVRDPQNRNEFWLEPIQRIAALEQVHFINITDKDWAEVDFHPDLERIQERIKSLNYPID